MNARTCGFVICLYSVYTLCAWSFLYAIFIFTLINYKALCIWITVTSVIRQQTMSQQKIPTLSLTLTFIKLSSMINTNACCWGYLVSITGIFFAILQLRTTQSFLSNIKFNLCLNWCHGVIISTWNNSMNSLTCSWSCPREYTS